jgi:hypothetical protein
MNANKEVYCQGLAKEMQVSPRRFAQNWAATVENEAHNKVADQAKPQHFF